MNQEGSTTTTPKHATTTSQPNPQATPIQYSIDLLKVYNTDQGLFS